MSGSSEARGRTSQGTEQETKQGPAEGKDAKPTKRPETRGDPRPGASAGRLTHDNDNGCEEANERWASMAGVEQQAGTDSRPTRAAQETVQTIMQAMGLQECLEQHCEVHEVCCGVGSMSEEIQKIGIPATVACDTDEDARKIYKERHPQATMHDSMQEMTQWARDRRKTGRRIIVVGGPPCTAMSEAGKQQFDQDSSTDLLLDMMVYAMVVAADLVILENVLGLLDDRRGERLRHRLLQKAQEAGLRLADITRLKDSICGGGTQRQRGFWWFASEWLLNMLPEWPGAGTMSHQPTAISAALRPLDQVDQSVLVKDAGTLVARVPAPVESNTGVPIVVGRMYIHPRLMVGDTVTLQYSGIAGKITDVQGGTYKLKLNDGKTTAVQIRQISEVKAQQVANRIRGGQYVSVWGEQGTWKIMSVSESKVQLRLSDRENPRAKTITPGKIKTWEIRSEPVYSRQSVSIGLRRWGEPVQQNSFLITCPKLGVRRLYGDEMWRLHGLAPTTIDIPHYRLGELAGNAVTNAMATVVAHMVRTIVTMAIHAARKQKANTQATTQDARRQEPDVGKDPQQRKRKAAEAPKEVSSQSKKGESGGWLDTTTGQREEGSKRVILLLVSNEDKPRVAVRQEGRLLPGVDVNTDSRWHKEGKRFAEHMKKELLRVPQGVVELAHQFEEAGTITLVFYSVVPHSPLHETQWLQPADLKAGEQVYSYALLATQAMLQTAPRGVYDDDLWQQAQARGVHTTATSGAVQAGIVGATLEEEGMTQRTSQEVLTVLNGCDEAQRVLEKCLREANLPLWADKLKPVPREALMVNALRERLNPRDERLASVVAEERCEIPSTDPVNYQDFFKPRDPPPDFRPTKLEHLLKPWAIELINKWVKRNLKYLQRCRDFEKGLITEEECRRDDNKTLALGEDAYWPEAYGVPWDLSRLHEGVITVFRTDTDTRHITTLQVDFIVTQMQQRGLDDHQLRDFLLHGVTYCAKLGWQIVLSPHLLSLKNGYTKILAEIEGQADKHWHRFCDNIPMLPFRGIPNGARDREKEDRPRPLKEAGAPREDMEDTAGEPVQSPNVASKAPTLPEAEPETAKPRNAPKVKPKWPKEHKPWVKDALMIMATLVYAAEILGEVVYAVGDDAKNYFNHMRLHPSQYPYMGTFCDDAQNKPRWIVNQIMEFGIAPASNIAQRLSNVLMRIFAETFEETEKDNVEHLRASNKRFDEWYRHRQSLSRAAGRTLTNLFGNVMYTDDPLLLCCGAQRTTRMVLCWEWTTNKFGLMMANPIKRSIGVHVDWLGVSFLVCLAVAWVPRHKAIKAMTQITAAQQGALTLADYRRLLGRLANYVFVLSLQPTMLAGLWRPLQAQWDPGAMVRLNKYMSEKLERWMTFLTTIAAVTTARVVLGARLSNAANVLTVTVDACKDGEGTPGLGAFLHGLYERVQLHGDYMLLPIAVLEFIANALALVTFKDILLQHIAGGGYVHLRTDAVSPAWALQKKKAKSPLMVHVLEYLMGLRELTHLWKGLIVSQLYGERNTAADAISRGLWKVFKELCKQLKVKATRMHGDVDQLLITTLAKQLDMIKEHSNRRTPEQQEAALRQKGLQAMQVAKRRKKETPPRSEAARDKAVEQERAITCAGSRANSASEPRLEMLPSDDEEQDTPDMTIGNKRMQRQQKAQSEGDTSSTPPQATRHDNAQKVEPEQSPGRCRATKLLMTPPTDSETDSQEMALAERGKRERNDSSPTTRGEAQRQRRKGAQIKQEHGETQSWHQSTDRGKYSFGGSDPELVEMLSRTVQKVMSKSIPHSVQPSYRSHIKRWEKFCKSLDTTPRRDDIASNLGINLQGHKDEIMLLAFATMDALQDMQPRAGRKAPLPDSAKNYLYAVADYHASMMPPITMVPIKTVSKLFKALNVEYKEQWGIKDMIKKQREPLKKWHIRKLLALTDSVVKLGRKNWKRDSLRGRSILALIATQANTGMRKSEVTLPDSLQEWNKSLINWASVKWRIKGKYYAELTLEAYLQLDAQDYLILTPPPAKADPFCKVWGGRPVYIRYDPEGGINAAYWLAQLEHDYPVPLQQRDVTPLFRDDGGEPLKAGWWNRALKTMLSTFMGAEEVKLYTTHSFRIYLACAAHESGRAPEEIQALCRWRSTESLLSYVRWSPEKYADMVEAAMTVEINPLHVTNLPHLDPGPLVQAVADAE